MFSDILNILDYKYDSAFFFWVKKDICLLSKWKKDFFKLFSIRSYNIHSSVKQQMNCNGRNLVILKQFSHEANFRFLKRIDLFSRKHACIKQNKWLFKEAIHSEYSRNGNTSQQRDLEFSWLVLQHVSNHCHARK